MTFNQQLIQKARKGEIAILNDGGAEELEKVLQAVWPHDYTASQVGSAAKYFVSHPKDSNVWYGTHIIAIPTHSVKEFIMPDTKDKPIFRKENEGHQPRTYRVTRQHMKEIWEAAHNKNPIRKLAEEHFAVFAEDIQIDDALFLTMRHCFNQEKPQILVKHFPEYFFIPEGEPVWCRESDVHNWMVGVSDGKGAAYSHHGAKETIFEWKQIIPFTKNPPK